MKNINAEIFPNKEKENEIAITYTKTVRGGFVWNNDLNDYELLFVTEIGSELLTRNRAIEKATLKNKYTPTKSGQDIYDISKVIVKEREETIQYGQWKECKEKSINTFIDMATKKTYKHLRKSSGKRVNNKENVL